MKKNTEQKQKQNTINQNEIRMKTVVVRKKTERDRKIQKLIIVFENISSHKLFWRPEITSGR